MCLFRPPAPYLSLLESFILLQGKAAVLDSLMEFFKMQNETNHKSYSFLSLQ